jgi:two-component system, cell cycle sensor histidine kinase and response regulator CckA
MKTPVRILHLEDNPADGDLIRATLEQEHLGGEIHRVVSREAFIAGIEAGGYDLILADYNLPAFDGLTALTLARARRPEIPFLFVSGFIGEEVALESLKNGATDYVFKHNFARLAPAIRRALEAASVRREREAAEAALQEREATLRSFFDTAPFLMGLLEWREDEVIHLSGNAATVRFLNVPPEAIQQRFLRDLGLPTQVVTRATTHYAQCQREKRAVELDYSFEWLGQTRHFAVTLSPVACNEGQPSRCCYIAEDITEKKQLERQYLRAQRLESVGTLASGLAHDLNNVLAPIVMALRLFRAKLPDPEDQELLTNLESSARRGADIIRQVLTFARGVEGERQPVALPRLLGELEKIIRETFARSIQLEMRVAPDLRPILGDSTQIYQVLMNLSVNARDAMPSGGLIRIEARNLELDADATRSHPGARPGEYVQITLADTGIGIAPELIDKIFDPFFTTKDLGHGTGLGLPTTLSIVKSHGGWITVESEPGRGSEFHVFLPASSDKVAATAEATPREQPLGQGELVLVVDDDATLKQVARSTLLKAGYQVLTAGDGQEALDIFQTHRQRIALVLTDMMMPRMDGHELIAEIRKLTSTIPILTMSGLVESRPAPGQPALISAFLNKPFTAESLLQSVHAALHESQPSLPL